MRNALLLSAVLIFVGESVSAESIPCAAGVEVTAPTLSPAQGQLMLLMITSPAPLEDLKAGWAGQSLHFWQAQEGENTYNAFLGVDLLKKPGTYPMSISAMLGNGERVGCSVSLSIQKGDFIVERLNVENRYVELSQEDLERSRRESARIRKIFSSVTPEKLWQGEFRLPLGERFKGSGNFGKRRILNDQPRSPHSGEDFSAPTGTPIHAPQRGRVVVVQDLFFSGNTVVLDHGFGLYTYHCHMSAFSVEEGDMVEAGTVLGKVGATGRVTGPHLHWTVRLNNLRVNPRDLIELFSDTADSK